MATDPLAKTDYFYHYQKFFSGSDKEFESMSRIYEQKLRNLGGLKPTSKVLEVGSGWGFCLGGLRRLGVTDAIGFDVDPAAHEMAVRRGLNVKLLDVAKIPAFMRAHEAAFDFVLAFDVVEHIPTSERADMLSGVLNALKPGGCFVCQVPNASSFISSYMRYIDYTHTDTFTHFSLDAVLHNAGFDNIVVQDADPLPQRPPIFPLSEFKVWLAKRLLRKLLRAIYVVELGSTSQVWSIPLDKNIVAMAHRPFKT